MRKLTPGYSGVTSVGPRTGEPGARRWCIRRPARRSGGGDPVRVDVFLERLEFQVIPDEAVLIKSFAPQLQHYHMVMAVEAGAGMLLGICLSWWEAEK